MESTTAIKVSGLGKKYTIGKQKDASLRSTLTNVFKSAAAKGDDFWAVQNVDFEIKRGDVVGIIGKNGAGKSTLLKLLSQITKPTTGRIEINGRVASLLEVGTGFHPELTGRENIYLNGTILGMSRKEVKEKFNDIVEFSGVAKFIDTPVKHYSSGMYVRLAFSVAAHLEPEILIIDEVLAVGDAEFQKKCIGKMSDVAAEGRTVIFVSHNIAAIKELCTKGIVMNKGEILFSGNQLEAIEFYHELGRNVNSDEIVLANDKIEILSFNVNPVEGSFISISSGFSFELEFRHLLENKNLAVTFELSSKDEIVLFHHGEWICNEKDSQKGIYKMRGEVPKNILNAGHYFFKIIIASSLHEVLLTIDSIGRFEVTNEALAGNNTILPGLIRPNLKYEFNFTKE
ncbi:MAG: polysaccharide/polyol phosphate ABC transporter ATP-binding protein [Fluviicola sp.]|nr:MAG: polysaccharide/polyol phosphate ABC transporter ATP-binding protein [Fluviicola sp.]